jgi:hypothetical protein
MGAADEDLLATLDHFDANGGYCDSKFCSTSTGCPATTDAAGFRVRAREDSNL